MRMELMDDGRFLFEAMSGEKMTLTKHNLTQLTKLAENLLCELQDKPTRGAQGIVTTPKPLKERPRPVYPSERGLSELQPVVFEAE